VKLYIGIPSRGGVCAEFVSSLLKTHLAFNLAGFAVEVDMHLNTGIAGARNAITNRFMKSGFDKLLFLDTDMVWGIEDIFKIVKSEHEVCAMDYRKKTEETVYTGAYTGREKDGWAEALWVGTGLMCIARSTFEKMIPQYPETRYVSDDGIITFALFADMVIEAQFCTDDTTFCKRWTKIGGGIAVLKDAETSHIGNKSYNGNLKGHINDISKAS